MCLSIEDMVAKDGSFDGVPPAGISFNDYEKLMNGDAAEKAAKYNAR